MKHDNLASMRSAVRDGLAPRCSTQPGHFSRSAGETVRRAFAQFIQIGGAGIIAFAIATIILAFAGAHS